MAKSVWTDPNDFPEFNFDNPDKVIEKKDEDEGDKGDLEKKDDKEEKDPFKDFDFGGEKVSIGDDENKPTGEEFDSSNSGPKDTDYASLAGALQDAGVFGSIEFDDKKPMGVNALLELHQKEVENRFEHMVDDFASSFDDDAKMFIEFKKNGGETADFFTKFKSLAERPKLDISDESSVEAVARYYLKEVSKVPVSEINERIEFLKEKDRLFGTVEVYNSQLDELSKQKRQSILDDEVDNKKKYEQNVAAFKDTVRSSMTGESFKGFTNFNAKEVEKAILNTITTGESKGSTLLNVKLSEVFADTDKTKLIMLTHLLLNDFNFDGLEKKIKGDVVKDEQRRIREIKVGLMSSPSGNNSDGNSLWDRL